MLMEDTEYDYDQNVKIQKRVSDLIRIDGQDSDMQSVEEDDDADIFSD